jgi:hypothetical protein
VALLPIAKQSGPIGTGALGAWIMDVKVKMAIGVALVACGAWGVWPLVGEGPEIAPPIVARADAPLSEEEKSERDAPAPASSMAAPSGRVVAESAATAPSGATDESAPQPHHVRCRVLDPRAMPRSGVRIALEWASADRRIGAGSSSTSLESTSDASGVVEFDVDPRAGTATITAADPDLTTLLGGQWQRGSTYEPVIVVAALRPLAGLVVDEDGRRVAGARLTLRLDPGFESRFAHVLDASRQEEWRTETDAAGAFVLPRAPAVDGARLSTTHERYLPDQRSAPEVAVAALEIVLKTPRPDETAIHGVVLGPLGETIEGARVVLGASSTKSDHDGRFVLDPAKQETAELLQALKPGFMPASLLAAGGPSDARRWPGFVTLTLGGPTRSIGGTVVDEDGKPLSGMRVWLADPTYCGRIEGTPTQVENVLAGSKTHAEIQREGDLDPSLKSRDAPGYFWTWVSTDAQGRFRIDGLLAREYRLEAMDGRSLVHAEVGPFESGSEDVRIVLPTRDVRTIRGRVVTRAGEPVGAVRVSLVRTTMEVSYATAGGTARTSRGMPGAGTVTAEDGRFTLENVPVKDVFVTLDGDAILPHHRAITPEDVESSIELVVTARCHFQVELAEPVDRADSIAVLDAEGERLPLLLLRGDSNESGPTKPLSAGRTPVLAVGETAATLVLLRGKEEVERHPIVLLTKTLNELRF